MIDDLEEIDLKVYSSLLNLKREAIVLDRFYIPTRYPNGLPDITPDEVYDEEDASTCIKHAKKIIDTIQEVLAHD